MYPAVLVNPGVSAIIAAFVYIAVVVKVYIVVEISIILNVDIDVFLLSTITLM